ncbi:MAG: MBL fold metallo-hydrolase [Gemmataceae bacterium]|nr:MBL fold metallo-hydrolase [Gemmataceae bacterium]
MTTPYSGPTVTFWGAARTVSGSMHLVQVGDEQILLDCGLFLERRAETRQRNRIFPFDPYRVKAVVLSHAHIDHCGNLANLVRQGFGGPIYCTPPTRDLLALMLADSARIQAEEAQHANILRQPHEPWVDPLYGREDAERTLQLCVPIPYDLPHAISSNVQLVLRDAGHVLGSAMVSLTIAWGSRDCTLTFTGDHGRRGMPLLRDPAPLPPSDVVICESTYGSVMHEPVERMAEALRVMVQQTVARGGKVLIPAFSLGRSQMLVHYVQTMMHAGKVPRVPIFVDSPLATDISAVYRRHPNYLHADAARQLADGPSFLDGPQLHYIRSLDESKQLNLRREPCVIVASSGMCEGGRVLHHLKHTIDDPRCSVVLVSFQAPDTLGWRLMERKPTVRFLGRDWNKWADVVALKGFSGHADQGDLLTSLVPLAGRTRTVRLVHGEVESSEAMATALRQRGFADAATAEHGETVPLI